MPRTGEQYRIAYYRWRVVLFCGLYLEPLVSTECSAEPRHVELLTSISALVAKNQGGIFYDSANTSKYNDKKQKRFAIRRLTTETISDRQMVIPEGFNAPEYLFVKDNGIGIRENHSNYRVDAFQRPIELVGV